MKKIALKVTSAFLVDGKIAKVGDVVEVGESDAKSLLHRGKAVLATVKAAEADKQPGTDPHADGALTDEGTTAAEPQAEAAQPEAAAESAPKAKAKKGK